MCDFFLFGGKTQELFGIRIVLYYKMEIYHYMLY